jgi:cell division inhibitor SepF
MASGMVRRAMVYLGLVDDDYEDYEAYEEQPPANNPRPASRAYMPEGTEMGGSGGQPGVRTIPRDRDDTTGGSVIMARPQGVVRPMITPIQNAKVHVVAPAKFSDAQEIGDRFKNGQPVILNLQNADRELARRMIDFCSGVTYALGGSMEKAADQVFLVTPTNVEVSAEEKRRLQERGLYRS